MKKKLTSILSLTVIAMASIHFCYATTGMLELDGEVLPEPTSYTHPPLQPTVSTQLFDDVALSEARNIEEQLTLAQMGSPSPIVLSGRRLLSGVTFRMANDLFIDSATLTMKVKASSGLVQADQTLHLMLNGQPMGFLPLEEGEQEHEYMLEIPEMMLTNVNNLSFRLASRDALDEKQCMPPLADELSLVISPDSSLNYRGRWINGGYSLERLPLPFFDPDRMTATSLPIVLADKPDNGQVTAAAIAASWFGSFSHDIKQIDLPVLMNQLPDSDGVLIGYAGQTIAGITLPSGKNGQLTIVDNPVDPVFKLLLISGDDEKTLRQAAWALNSGKLPPNDQLTVAAQHIPVRQDYDAPRWLNTNHPVTLGEIAHGRDDFTRQGINHAPNQFSFRVSPDLFWWDGDALPLDLQYVFPHSDKINSRRSSLIASLNHQFIGALYPSRSEPLGILRQWLGMESAQQSSTLYLDPRQIYSQNQLEFYFDLHEYDDAPCILTDGQGLISRIDPQSTLQFKNTWHYSRMPNLAYFSGASFPFSRRADFSQTTLLLPENPTTEELYTLVNLMARSGYSTGTPVSYISVFLGAQALEKNQLAQKDILAIGELGSNGFLPSAFSQKTFSFINNQLEIQSPSLIDKAKSWLAGDPLSPSSDAANYLAPLNDWRGMMSFISPWAKDRVVVLVTAKGNDSIKNIIGDLKHANVNAAIKGDLTLISGQDTVMSFHLGEHFSQGYLPLLQQFLWYCTRHVYLLGMLAVGFCALTGSVVYCWLQRRSTRRLSEISKRHVDK
ncbi:cellulose biosynthesis cyclic di-GMP-binding regulatory protein BcsB [Proteus mirabilis]|uniref:cellulose biosynthesis cyclic di-GMP-binding regulatory protein BcsB n=1 Tax=Proteus mirabilis TaxID=584 RepID=UPI001BB04DA7|nr:cellulose biosynthesis cyclic di-GMP-binding regulatory protein BcsB [Proteus mirabilis]MBS3875319.1 cellulose biosynthesis cyclic di-GMP-binding regulatory protein BcsB [Proteus mirabilis]MCT0235839.1 cellulose biosynthesis cyclic di-GMP-binding regulatory protein BcsB [Proteus mirabilis]